MKNAIWLLLVCALVMTTEPASASGRGRHKKLYVVPRPAAVQIDGKLDDWDLSGQIHSYVIPETADMQSARLAMMYDDEALYISGVVRDDSPMMNRHDPKVDPQRAWDADVCQVFLSLDPRLEYPVEGSSFAKDPLAPVGTMYLWYFTDRQEPCLALFRGMRFDKALRPELGENGVVPAELFQGAYEKAEDGRGYTFEYRIPFATLGLPVNPKANDILAAVTCVFWSRPDGLKTAGGAAWAYDVMAGPGFPWQSTLCYGKLIFAPEGNIPRELVEEGLPPEKPLPLKFAYEVPEDSQVTVQLYDEKNLVRRILVAQGDRRAGTNVELWDGMDDQGTPLPPGTYTWKGIYHEPITQKYLFSPHNSGQPTYPTDNNRGGWGGDHGSPTTVCAVPGGMVLAWGGAEYGWGIIRVTLDGKKLWGSKHSAQHLATDGKRLFAVDSHGFHAAPGVKVFDLKDGRPINFGNGNPYLLPPPGGTDETNQMTGLAYVDGKIAVAYAKRNLIAVFDATSGEQLNTQEVASPHALAALPNGDLAAISDNQVLALSGGPNRVLIDGLDEPRGLAVAKDGTLHVTQAGAKQAVTVHAANGKYLRTIGKEGGRPAIGLYDPSGMYMPGGADLDEQGRLWVAETTDSPKRISVWSTTDGTNLAEYFGACSYFGYGWIDPDKPSEIYSHNVLWKIDWQANTTAPHTTIWRKTTPDMMDAPDPAGYNGHMRIITAANGQQYGLANARFKTVAYRRDGDVFKPFAATFSVNRGWSLWRGLGIPELDDPEKTADGNYFWQDSNDDQRVQLDEVHRYQQRNFRLSFLWMDKQLNLWCSGGYILRPVRWQDNGQPVYDPEKYEPTFLAERKTNYQYLSLDDEGNLYTLVHGGNPSLAKWSPTGELLWGYSNLIKWHDALNLPIVKAGRLWGMTGLLGSAGSFTGNMTYFGVCHVFQQSDGLYTAALMRDGRTGGAGPDIGQPEGQEGQLVRFATEPGGPQRTFLIAGGQDSRVTEVFGLETVKPLPGGTFDLTVEDAALAKQRLDEYQEIISSSQRLTIARGRKALDLAQSVTKQLDAQRGFEVRAAYDADALYLKVEVTSPFALANAYNEPTLLFKGGNCIDLQLAADPNAPADRKTPAAGDLRLLVTRHGNQTLAIIYRPKVDGFAGEPTVLKSPTGQESFDQIAVTDAVALEYRPNKTKDGFTAVLTIPHRLTDLALKPNSTLRMDIGYIFGNAQGTQTATRVYWRNNSFTANVINDIPHESRLEPSQWGEALVE